MVAVLIGMALVYGFFPGKAREDELRAGYVRADEGAAEPRDVPARPAAVPRPVAAVKRGR